MINSRDPQDLLPEAAAKHDEFVSACAAVGIDVLTTSTYRDHESQASLYAIGRTVLGADPTPERPMGRTVTNAKPGDSYHNWKVAWDFVPIVNGKAMWKDEAAFRKCGEIAESLGIEWAGRWKSFPELAHCQYTGGLRIADFKAQQVFA